jgi:exodeoxyribonuclease V alpha subunit
VYNGDIGIITEIDARNECFTVEFDDKISDYDFSQFDEIEHAYAVTVHKSQGSEYPCVIIPLVDAPFGLLTRNMLYTAVTRAQQRVIIVGKEQTVKLMVSNNRQMKRYTGLCRMLKAFVRSETEKK